MERFPLFVCVRFAPVHCTRFICCLTLAFQVDMEKMTDAFMTAAVVAALATGTTRITGIANQRVKVHLLHTDLPIPSTYTHTYIYIHTSPLLSTGVQPYRSHGQ